MTPLHHAASRGQASTVGTLARFGADVDARGENGATPLHEAARRGHTEAVRALLERRAQVNEEDERNRTTPRPGSSSIT